MIVILSLSAKKIASLETIISEINSRYTQTVSTENETEKECDNDIDVEEPETESEMESTTEPTTEPQVEEPTPEEPKPDPEPTTKVTTTSETSSAIDKDEPKPEPEPTVDPDKRELLACVIFQEAGGDAHCDECRRRVADVVLNRVNDSRFPNTIHGVLTQKGQYGKFSKTGVRWPERANKKAEQHAVKRAYRIAEEVLSGKHSDLYGKGYIWQATFKQSKDNVYCCGHYFGR
jgi:hypothetical protein